MATPKLSPKLIKQIKTLLTKGLTQKAIAAKLKVSVGTVSNVKTGTVDAAKVDPTNKRINELEGRLHQAHDELTQLKRKVKAVQKDNIGMTDVVDSVSEWIIPFKAPTRPLRGRVRSSTPQDMVLFLSDGHWDTVVKPEQCLGIEETNFQVSMARAEHLVENVLDDAKDVDRLWVLNLGDMTNGEIHEVERHTHFGNAYQSDYAAGCLLGQMVLDFARHFREVKVVCISGNHGRKPGGSKQYYLPQNNHDFAVSRYAETYCRNLSSVEFQINDSFVANIAIRGHRFHLCHGDDIRSAGPTPFYGICRKTGRLVALSHMRGERLDAVAMGHFHQPFSNEAAGVTTIVNGCWLSTDPYVFNALDGATRPSQLLMLVSDDHLGWRRPIDVKFDGDVKGPKRYRLGVRAA